MELLVWNFEKPRHVAIFSLKFDGLCDLIQLQLNAIKFMIRYETVEFCNT